jgi:hypothetical protein
MGLRAVQLGLRAWEVRTALQLCSYTMPDRIINKILVPLVLASHGPRR